MVYPIGWVIITYYYHRCTHGSHEVTKSSSRWENMNQLEPRTSISKWSFWVPSGKHTKNYGTSPFLMGKSTISTGPCSNAMQQIARGYILWCFMTFLLCWDVGSIENHYGMMIREPRVESRRFFLKKKGLCLVPLWYSGMPVTILYLMIYD